MEVFGVLSTPSRILCQSGAQRPLEVDLALSVGDLWPCPVEKPLLAMAMLHIYEVSWCALTRS